MVRFAVHALSLANVVPQFEIALSRVNLGGLGAVLFKIEHKNASKTYIGHPMRRFGCEPRVKKY